MSWRFRNIRATYRTHSAFPVALVLCMFIATFPLFDPDLYWHLANGREMVATQSIVNEEIFSYTHSGERFVNHEWLAQVLFFGLWRTAGAHGLLALKLLLTAFVSWFTFRTARSTGAGAWLAALVVVLAVLAGIRRYHVRPELFSLLNISVLGYLLHGYRRHSGPYRRLWFIPFMFLVWDWLHGAVVGLLFLVGFVVIENLRAYLRFSGAGFLRHNPRLGRLNICLAAVLLIVAVNPYGVRSYGHFRMLATGSHGAGNIFELQPVWQSVGDHVPILFMIVWALLLMGMRARRMDGTDAILLLIFSGVALRFSRLSGIAAIVLAPIIAKQVVTALAGARMGTTRRFAQGGLLAAGLVVLGFTFKEKIIEMGAAAAPNGTYVLPSETAFGFAVNEHRTPAGSVRFIKDLNLGGNLYNNGDFGGYLAYYLWPDRPIFQYNMPPIFGDTMRFIRHPRELDRYQVNYALVGSRGELTKLFPRRDWAWIYNDYVSTLLLRRTTRNERIIDLYEVQYFTPEQSSTDFRIAAGDQGARPRLAFEMAVYLAYVRDDRIAERLVQLFADHPELEEVAFMQDIVAKAAVLNKGFDVR